MNQSDVLVIGSGIAGLTFALKVANNSPKCKITIITKADKSESNTKYAQGGIAVVWDDNDSFENHIKDTLIAGDGACDDGVVKMVVEEAPARLKEIINWGADFDLNKEGNYDLGKEGGHGENRIIHHKDVTGLEIERKLLAQIEQKENIEILTHHFAIDIITQHHLGIKVPKSEIECYGVYVLNTKSGKIDRYISKVTMLASGGAGQVYANTTNPKIATGDGIAMAYRAKARIEDIAFIQFHPTALFDPKISPSFLISEAVRGFGAYLRTKDGNRFMLQYDDRAELASRDIVAQAIDKELKKTGDEFIYLDCTHLNMETFKHHFPNIYAKCASIGIHIEKDFIPVVPAAHYSCGGIDVDSWGNTSIKGLMACGECSRTGLHGANRLASNSLLEALVFAERSFQFVNKNISKYNHNEKTPKWDASGTNNPKELVIIAHARKELQAIMSNFVGIARSNARLKRALKRTKDIYEETEKLYEASTISPQLCELRNLITCAHLIISHSQKQTENRGTFYNTDLS